MNFINLIDYAGTFAFAISGIRLASAKRFDWFGAYVVGLVTAIGGGTTRDLLLNVTPFWMLQPSYLIVTAFALLSVITSIIAFFISSDTRSPAIGPIIPHSLFF